MSSIGTVLPDAQPAPLPAELLAIRHRLQAAPASVVSSMRGG